MWIDRNSDGRTFFWRFEWPADSCADLVSWDNPHGRITNSDLKLAALFFTKLVSHICVRPTSGTSQLLGHITPQL